MLFAPKPAERASQAQKHFAGTAYREAICVPQTVLAGHIDINLMLM